MVPSFIVTCVVQVAVLPLVSVAVAVIVDNPTFIEEVLWLCEKKFVAPCDE